VRTGFETRYLRTPSWTVRKGAVVGLRPKAGTYLRRPARVTILVASGYPRSVVPDVRDSDLASAESRLESSGLHFRLVYRLTDSARAGTVLDQIPRAGISVYEGAQVRLTVARTLQWMKIFSATGTDAYESDAFAVPARWRVRYRLDANSFGFAFARITWTHDGDFFGAGNFTANASTALRTYGVPDGAGTYRLSVSPYAGSRWYVEIDAFR